MINYIECVKIVNYETQEYLSGYDRVIFESNINIFKFLTYIKVNVNQNLRLKIFRAEMNYSPGIYKQIT